MAHTFIARQLSLEVITALREIVRVLRKRDRSLAEELEEGANSAFLNLAEGGPRAGKDQAHCYRVAAGSAAEARASVDGAEAWGHLDGLDLGPVRELFDRQAAMLYRLVHPRRR